MAGVRVLGTPPLPWVSGPSRRPRSGSTRWTRRPAGRGSSARSRPPACCRAGAQAAYALPYSGRGCRSGTACRPARPRWAYETSRRWPGPRGAGGLVRVQVGSGTPPTSSRCSCTARWGLFSRFHVGAPRGRRSTTAPWPLHRARLLDLERRPGGGGRPAGQRGAARAVVARRWTCASAGRPCCVRRADGVGRLHDLGLPVHPLRTWLLFAVLLPVVGRVLEAVGLRCRRRTRGRQRCSARRRVSPRPTGPAAA
jgi:hypothetical protein